MALRACTKVVDGLGRIGAQTICAAARNIELVFSNSGTSNDPEVISAGFDFLETTLSVRAPPEVDWEVISAAHGKSPRQFGQLVKTLLSLGASWLCANDRLTGSILSTYFDQVTIVPSKLQNEVLETYEQVHQKVTRQIGSKIFTANVLRTLAGVFRRTTDEGLKKWTTRILQSVVKNKPDGIANYIDITQPKTNLQELLHNYKLLPMMKDALDFESEASMKLVAHMLANREELWIKFFSFKHTRHSRKLLKMALESKIEVAENFRDKNSERTVRTVISHTLPGRVSANW